ncbi:microspherule protein 1-like [Gigantopelta aegis]|uniref:microspherule protein 1-like n=1 Tax=Gigantopelta aegis TaxID=1735272 RepID=UPI001B88B337|nr:microspherule protein 1-like [Gigantopelta aegis]
MADSLRPPEKSEVADDRQGRNVSQTVSESEKHSETPPLFSSSLVSALQTSPQVSNRLPKPAIFATPEPAKTTGIESPLIARLTMTPAGASPVGSPGLASPTMTPIGVAGTPSSTMKPRRMQSIDPRELIPPRRSSTRSIKRKKFDDEVVESSLLKTERGRIRPPNLHPLLPAEKEKEKVSVEVPTPKPEEKEKKEVEKREEKKPVEKKIAEKKIPVAPPPEKKIKKELVEKKSFSKKKSSKSKRSKRQKSTPATSTKDLGRWKPQDDLALITAIQQTNDLTGVHLGVKFSSRFSLKEIQERWYALLYDPSISKLSIQTMKMLHPDVCASIQAKALYSKEEENLVGKIPSNTQPQPTVDVFQDLLQEHPQVFHPARTAKALHNHWLLMKQYHLLPDQSVQPMPRGDHVLNLSDAEDMMNDDELKDSKDNTVEQELDIADRRNKREIRHLEQELPKWQVLVDSVTGISPPDFDNQTLAVLRGRLVRYLMRSREITLGRATKDNQIDVDLSLEGPAWKISRRQGVIKLRNSGDFFIANEGKRPIYIDGKPVLAGNKQKLYNNSVVEISCLRFIFLINQDIINVIRAEAQKLTAATAT